MNAREALESLKTQLKKYVSNENIPRFVVEIAVLESILAALDRLEAIEKRANEKRELFQKGIETSKGTCVEPFVEVSNTFKIRLINYILNGKWEVK